jgi:alkaline phosphatase D
MSHEFTRRGFLLGGGSLLALTWPEQGRSTFLAEPSFKSNPFAQGIASGDPLPGSVVLWTRLMPGSPDDNWLKDRVKVDWEIATDEKMAKVVKKDTTFATPELGHSVHVDAVGLKSDTWYYYRFRAGGEASPIGRTKTAPDAKAANSKLNFAFASCQHFETGYYTAYQHMVREDIDLIVHLGDYIYEREGMDGRIRKHTGLEINSLTDYRNRYALYRTDPHLREAHRMFPWIVTWDDHEVDNNYAGDIPEDKQTRTAFLERRANAYQAYYESMPLRRTSMPQGTKLQLYRSFRYGSLANFAVLDTRQYRTDQPCNDGDKPVCETVMDPKATMMGPEQEEWLKKNLRDSKSTWNVLANQVMMAKVDRKAGAGESFPMDQWAGYEVARARLMRYFAEQKPSNPVVITGDIHSSWVADLREDWRNTAKPVVATEFVGTSITSGGDGSDMRDTVKAYLPENPHVKFFNGQRGYVKCSLTPTNWTTDYRVVDKVTVENAPVHTRASFVVDAGRPGAQKV